jgi:hypothetical protein
MTVKEKEQEKASGHDFIFEEENRDREVLYICNSST